MVRKTFGLVVVLGTILGMSMAVAKPPVSKKKTSPTRDDNVINQMATMAAMSNVLSNNTAGLSSKLAISMAGKGSDFVLGHGSGGMGFRGTGTGGGGTDGYGNIHGLGKLDTKGVGLTFKVDASRRRPAGKLTFGTPTFGGKVTKTVKLPKPAKAAGTQCDCNCGTMPQRK